MNTKELVKNVQQLLKKLGEYFDLGKKERKKRLDDLKVLLKQLKHKEEKLISICRELSPGNKRKMIKREIAVLHAKRQKGLKVMKKLIRS